LVVLTLEWVAVVTKDVLRRYIVRLSWIMSFSDSLLVYYSKWIYKSSFRRFGWTWCLHFCAEWERLPWL